MFKVKVYCDKCGKIMDADSKERYKVSFEKVDINKYRNLCEECTNVVLKAIDEKGNENEEKNWPATFGIIFDSEEGAELLYSWFRLRLNDRKYVTTKDFDRCVRCLGGKYEGDSEIPFKLRCAADLGWKSKSEVERTMESLCAYGLCDTEIFPNASRMIMVKPEKLDPCYLFDSALRM